MNITFDDVLDEYMKSLYDLIEEARIEALRNGIKANSIVINDNLVKVPESYGEYPDMICGLKTYRTSCDLPKNYIFAVVHDPNRKPKPEWIPVTEGLPEIFVPVLVKYLNYNDGSASPTNIDTAVLLEGNVWYWWEGDLCDCNEEVKCTITHWMPLPEPPKEGE